MIDLVYETPDGWEILDYKTDQVSATSTQILQRYSGQIEAYRKYWSKQALGPVKRIGLYLVRSGDVLWLNPLESRRRGGAEYAGQLSAVLRKGY